jgi:hypothetical protein
MTATEPATKNHPPQWHQGCSVAQSAINAFFMTDSSKCGDGDEALYGLFFTLPAFCSITYSVGAWIALRTRRPGEIVIPSLSELGVK